MALFLHNLWYSSIRTDDVIQYVSWIRDDNEASIRLHSRLGYIQRDTYKITMQKGIEEGEKKRN